MVKGDKVKVNNPTDTLSGQSYYSGEGTIRDIDLNNGKIAVYFMTKGTVWFSPTQVKLINEL